MTPSNTDLRVLRAMRRYFTWARSRVRGRPVLCGGKVTADGVVVKVPEGDK